MEGETFQNSNHSRSFTISSGAYHCNSENVVYLLQCDCCNKNMWPAQKPNFGKDLMCTSRIFEPMHVNTMRAAFTMRGKAVPQAGFFGHFFSEGHQGAFSVSIKIIDGASDVYSLRRKELFWQYKLGTFAPNTLNERAADIELDMFACGTA